MWSLSNAFASAFKKLDPIPQFKATANVGEFLNQLPARGAELRVHGAHPPLTLKEAWRSSTNLCGHNTLGIFSALTIMGYGVRAHLSSRHLEKAEHH
jgi:hypothetical protein